MSMQHRSNRRELTDASRFAMIAALAIAGGAAGVARAQSDKMVAIDTPAQPNAITLDTGPLPDAPTPESWHKQYDSVFARNVTVATLTPFLPDSAKATGAAVVVAPGGGFRSLSMENEGWNVAKALNAKGVAAFVLKYRLIQTPASLEEFGRPPMPRPANTPPATRTSTPPAPAGPQFGPQIADAEAAFALIRSRAAEWHVDPDRVGMVGFSAGAMLTMATALHSDAHPAFLGDVYGPMAAMDVPADAPPLFIAKAADDPLIRNDFGLFAAWSKAGRPVELHLFEQGGHGFGMYPKETTSTGWFDAFYRWLAMHGYLKPKA